MWLDTAGSDYIDRGVIDIVDNVDPRKMSGKPMVNPFLTQIAAHPSIFANLTAILLCATSGPASSGSSAGLAFGSDHGVLCSRLVIHLTQMTARNYETGDHMRTK